MSTHVNSGFESMSCVGEHVSQSPGGIYGMLSFLAQRLSQRRPDRQTEKKMLKIKNRETQRVCMCVIERQRHWMSES